MQKMLSNKWVILAFVAPAVLLYAMVVPYPLLKSIQYSFYRWNIIGTAQFVGFQNYVHFTSDYVFTTAQRIRCSPSGPSSFKPTGLHSAVSYQSYARKFLKVSTFFLVPSLRGGQPALAVHLSSEQGIINAVLRALVGWPRPGWQSSILPFGR